MAQEKVLSRRTYRGFPVVHIREDAFRGLTPWNAKRHGWSVRSYWWCEELDVEEKTWIRTKEAIDYRVDSSNQSKEE